MSNFYNQSNMDPNTGGGGFYNSGGYNSSQQQQPASQPYAYQGANVSQWQQKPTMSSAQQQQHQQPQGQQQQQQQQQQPSPSWNPNAGATVAGLAAQAAAGGFSNEAMLDTLMKGGSAAWKSGGVSFIPGFDGTMQILRTYFAVDNRYVKRKMQKVLFPFLSKQWRRVVSKKDLFSRFLVGQHLTFFLAIGRCSRKSRKHNLCTAFSG